MFDLMSLIRLFALKKKGGGGENYKERHIRQNQLNRRLACDMKNKVTRMKKKLNFVIRGKNNEEGVTFVVPVIQSAVIDYS